MIVVLPPATEESLLVTFERLDWTPTIGNVTVTCALLAEGATPATDGTDFTITTSSAATAANGNGTYRVTAYTQTLGSSDDADVSSSAGDYHLYVRLAESGRDDIIVEGPVTVRIK